MIKKILYKKKMFALIIKKGYRKKKGISFFTDNSANQQIGYMKHGKNYIIKPHSHNKRISKIFITSEVIILLKGILRVDFYDNKQKYLFSIKLYPDEIIYLVHGAHGFKIIKEVEMIEIKQGPYVSNKDKVKFNEIDEKKSKLKKYEFIPVNKPLIEKKDITEILKSLKEGWISSDGPEVKSFELNFSKLIKRKYSVAVSNGTAALEIAIKALDIKKGDEVIIPNFTIISNALAVLRQNAKPVLVDCDKENWNMKIEDIEKKITKKTKAIIATHIYNFPLDIDKIIKICKKHKIFLIEDAAEVIGQKYKNKMCGTFGDISTFSFYANKQITTGEGGMISTNNPKINQKCKSLRNLCFGTKDRFNHDDLGWNYRISNIQASLGLSQLKRINKIVKRREYIGAQYYKRLSTNKNIQILKPKCSFAKNIYWVVGLVIKNKISAKVIAKKLIKYGIQTRPFFWPMHKQTVLKKMGLFKREKYPNSEYLSKYGLYLPSSLSLNLKQISFIAKKVNEIIK